MEKSIKKQFLLKSASYLSIMTAAVILMLKTYAWIATSSSSIFASLVDSCLDISSSIINMFAIRYSLIPPDDKHRFGHDKMQDLAVLAQGSFFIATSIFVIFSVFDSISDGEVVINHDIGVKILVISTILTSALVSYQFYVLSQTDSNVIKADKLHYLTDLITNISVIFSVYYSQKYWFLDPLLAVFIALYLFWGAYKLLCTALKNLLDEEFSDNDKNMVLKILKSYIDGKNVLGIHDLKTRKAGDKHFIQLHIEMDANLTLLDAHKVTDKIENELMQLFHDTEVIIHQDPHGYDEPIIFKDKIDV